MGALGRMVENVARAGIRERHPEADERHVGAVVEGRRRSDVAGHGRSVRRVS